MNMPRPVEQRIETAEELTAIRRACAAVRARQNSDPELATDASERIAVRETDSDRFSVFEANHQVRVFLAVDGGHFSRIVRSSSDADFVLDDLLAISLEPRYDALR